MEDIAPKLLKRIQEDFDNLSKSSNKLQELQKKILSKDATYAEANDYAIELGKILAQAYKNNLSSDVLPDSKMYYNIAQRIIDPTMRNNYYLISKATVQVQKTLNENAGIGIKPIAPKLNEDKIKGIVNRVSNEDDFDKVKWILDEPIQTFSQSIVDDAIKANADFHFDSGLSPKIIRKVAGSCCKWCQEVAGTYPYPDVPQDVYRRHNRCRCTVDYFPRNGKVQNVHTKRWRNETKIEDEKLKNIDSIVKSDKIYTGARILDPNNDYAKKWAKSYYEEIRHKSTDYKKIAKRMSISEDDALKVKNYLFYDKVCFNPINGQWERFFPDAAIAQSWQRLSEGKEIFKHDKTLINHELLEMEIKKKNPSLSHQEAHDLTNKSFNYSEEADEYYANLRKRYKKE